MNYLKALYNNLHDPDFLANTLKAALAELTESERSLMQIEIKCFELMMWDGDLAPVIEIGHYRKTDIELLTEAELDYIKGRLISEQDDFLIARYAHILYKRSRDNRHAVKAIKAYREVAKQYLYQLQSKEKNVIDFMGVAEAYANLSLTMKFEIEECRVQLVEWYQHADQGRFYYQSMLDLFASSKLFKQQHLAGYTKAALQYLDQIPDTYDAEDYLEACLRVAQKERADADPVYIAMAENQLKMAAEQQNDATGLAVADCYMKAGQYYKLAKDRLKSDKVLRRLEAHKENVHFDYVESRMSDQNAKILTETISVIAAHILNDYPPSVFIGLALERRILPDLAKYQPSNENAFLSHSRASFFDINVNTHILSEFEQTRQDAFMYMQMGLELTIPPLFKELIRQMEESKRDFVKEGLAFFEGTWFKTELTNPTLDKVSIAYSWMPTVRPAIEILLQLNIENDKMLLTANQQMAFDQLAVKFEGLLRDLCEVANITVTKIIKDKTVAMDINDLLQSEELKTSSTKLIWIFGYMPLRAAAIISEIM
jgi:hypothetical protein